MMKQVPPKKTKRIRKTSSECLTCLNESDKITNIANFQKIIDTTEDC